MLATEDRVADQSPIPPLRILAREGGDEVRLGKIVAFEQQGLGSEFGQRICKTVPEIQRGRIPRRIARTAELSTIISATPAHRKTTRHGPGNHRLCSYGLRSTAQSPTGGRHKARPAASPVYSDQALAERPLQRLSNRLARPVGQLTGQLVGFRILNVDRHFEI